MLPNKIHSAYLDMYTYSLTCYLCFILEYTRSTIDMLPLISTDSSFCSSSNTAILSYIKGFTEGLGK